MLQAEATFYITVTGDGIYDIFTSLIKKAQYNELSGINASQFMNQEEYG
jgi:hypothetical protein